MSNFGLETVKTCPDGRRFKCPEGLEGCADGDVLQCGEPSFPWILASVTPTRAELVGKICLEIDDALCDSDFKRRVCAMHTEACQSVEKLCERKGLHENVTLRGEMCLEINESVCAPSVVSAVCTSGEEMVCRGLRDYCRLLAEAGPGTPPPPSRLGPFAHV